MRWYHSTKTAKIFWVTLDVAMHGTAYRRPVRSCPIYGYQKIFAVLVECYHHIVLTMSFKLESFLHLYNNTTAGVIYDNSRFVQ